MKKLLFILMLCIGMNSNAQNLEKAVSWKPYASVGTTLSSGVFSYGGEYGVYSSKAWYSVGVSTFKNTGNEYEWYASVRAYYKLNKASIFDNYFWCAVNGHIQKDRSLSFEPGVCTVINISDKWAPQIGLSFPIYENTSSILKPLQMNLSIGMNYWIR